MGNKNWRNLEVVRSEISGCIAKGNNCVIAVNFSQGRVLNVSPIRYNGKGRWTNQEAVLVELEEFGCGKREIDPQASPKIFDCENILLFQDRIA